MNSTKVTFTISFILIFLLVGFYRIVWIKTVWIFVGFHDKSVCEMVPMGLLVWFKTMTAQGLFQFEEKKEIAELGEVNLAIKLSCWNVLAEVNNWSASSIKINDAFVNWLSIALKNWMKCIKDAFTSDSLALWIRVFRIWNGNSRGIWENA